MESLYLLIPISLLIVLLIGAVLAWSVLGGQFDDLDREGRRILDDSDEAGRPPPVKAGEPARRHSSHAEPGPKGD